MTTTATETALYDTPESFRIAAASLGLDRNGLAQIFGISDRSAQRWISEWMPPQRVQDQMIAWQRALSALIEHDLDDIDRNAAPGTVIEMPRYPAASLMPPPDPASDTPQIWLHSPATYDAYLTRLTTALFDQQIPTRIHTATTPQDHRYRLI
ncbi:hypothetical protein [Kocuria palustris]|uniref:hypothetical protein n=1 Tax=Kocuria palustris TaxID=71999 RepID=UPI003D708F6A